MNYFRQLSDEELMEKLRWFSSMRRLIDNPDFINGFFPSIENMRKFTIRKIKEFENDKELNYNVIRLKVIDDLLLQLKNKEILNDTIKAIEKEFGRRKNVLNIKNRRVI